MSAHLNDPIATGPGALFNATGYRAITVMPSTARIGAEIGGVDLTRPLSTEQVEELRRAITEFQVIFFRDQPLDHASHEKFGALFGELQRHSAVAGIDGHPNIVKIHGDADSKYVAGEHWHSDLSCDASPPMGSILYLHTVPPTGGDTLFASMYAAYDALSDKMKDYLQGMKAVHDANHVYHRIFKDYDKRYPVSSHPIVRVHPVSGRRALFVNSQYVTHIEGVSEEESRAILGYLYQHCLDAQFHVRFRWKPHSIAFWDNRCTQHLAIWDYYPQVRSGYRVTIKGEAPVAV
ncbi:TauD/TfdA family dioxygenase [soil metagenome]